MAYLDLSLKTVTTVIHLFFNRIKSKSADLDIASKTFREAIIETEIYIGQFTRASLDKPLRQYTTEEKLARLWSEAAGDTRKVDRDIADSCELMAKYWADPTVPPTIATNEIKGLTSNLLDQGKKRDMARLADPPEIV